MESRLSGRGVRVLKVIHLCFPALWMGGAAALLPILATVDFGHAADAQRSYLALRSIAWNVIGWGGIGTVTSGLLLAGLSDWRFFRHRWVMAKLAMAPAMVLFGMFFIESRMLANLGLLEDGASVELLAQTQRTVQVGLTVLLAAFVAVITLSVFKPRLGGGDRGVRRAEGDKRITGAIIILVAAASLPLSACDSTEGSSAVANMGVSIPVLEFPLEGEWRVLRSPGHAEFAFDLAAVDQPAGGTVKSSRLGRLFRSLPASASYSWEKPVRAPANGEVVHAEDGRPDRRTLRLLPDLWGLLRGPGTDVSEDPGRFAGNHVIVRMRDHYLLLAHLRRGSVLVRPGDQVEAGDPIGRIGNSGASLEPHLHLQLVDQIDDVASAEAPPFVVASYERWAGDGWKPATGERLHRGDVVRSPPAIETDG